MPCHYVSQCVIVCRFFLVALRVLYLCIVFRSEKGPRREATPTTGAKNKHTTAVSQEDARDFATLPPQAPQRVRTPQVAAPLPDLGSDSSIFLLTNLINQIMGKAFQGVYGNWSGKTGNVVGHISQGRTIYSIYQKNVKNPRTASQLDLRLKFSLLGKLSARINPWLKQTFKSLDGYKTGNPRSAFVGYNFRQQPSVFDDVAYPNTGLEFENLQMSCGNTVALPTGIAAEANDHTVGVTWTDNSGEMGAEADDQAMMLVYNETKRRAIAKDAGDQRSTRRIECSYSNSWEGDTLHAWLVMKDATGENFSESYYLGDFEG